MMGRRKDRQGQFFYAFNLDEVVPPDHLVRQIDGVLDLSWVHKELAPYYSHTGRPSIDPVLMIRMLLVGSCLHSARSGGSALRFRSIWPIAGSASSVLKIRFPIIRCLAEPDMNAFARIARCDLIALRLDRTVDDRKLMSGRTLEPGSSFGRDGPRAGEGS